MTDLKKLHEAATCWVAQHGGSPDDLVRWGEASRRAYADGTLIESDPRCSLERVELLASEAAKVALAQCDGCGEACPECPVFPLSILVKFWTEGDDDALNRAALAAYDRANAEREVLFCVAAVNNNSCPVDCGSDTCHELLLAYATDEAQRRLGGDRE